MKNLGSERGVIGLASFVYPVSCSAPVGFFLSDPNPTVEDPKEI
jgi:hypothetical protein